MKECAAQCVLVCIGCTAEGEVVRSVGIDGTGCLQIKRTVRQCDVDRSVAGRVAERKRDGWVQILQLLVDCVVDEIHVS